MDVVPEELSCIMGSYRATAVAPALRAGRTALDSIMEPIEGKMEGRYQTAGEGCVDNCFCCLPDGSMGSFGVKVAQKGASAECG